MSIPDNKDARRIGTRSDSEGTELVDRFSAPVQRPTELRFWKNLLLQMFRRKASDWTSVGISDDRFRK